MGRIDDIYLQYCDEVDKEVKSRNAKTKEEVYEIVEEMKSDLIQDVDCAFDDIAYYYCEENQICYEDGV